MLVSSTTCASVLLYGTSFVTRSPLPPFLLPKYRFCKTWYIRVEMLHFKSAILARTFFFWNNTQSIRQSCMFVHDIFVCFTLCYDMYYRNSYLIWSEAIHVNMSSLEMDVAVVVQIISVFKLFSPQSVLLVRFLSSREMPLLTLIRAFWYCALLVYIYIFSNI